MRWDTNSSSSPPMALPLALLPRHRKYSCLDWEMASGGFGPSSQAACGQRHRSGAASHIASRALKFGLTTAQEFRGAIGYGGEQKIPLPRRRVESEPAASECGIEFWPSKVMHSDREGMHGEIDSRNRGQDSVGKLRRVGAVLGNNAPLCRVRPTDVEKAWRPES